MGCKDCALKNEKEIPYRGNPDAEAVFIFESAGHKEIEHGKMLIGKSLDYTVRECNRVGIDFNSLFLMNAARCRIDKDQLTDAQQGEVLKNCRPNVEAALFEIKPKLVVCFGAIAFRQIMYKSTLKKARNQFHWSKEFNCWIFCTYHPAAIMRDPNKLPVFQADFDTIARFIQNEYKAKDEVVYKEVESIRPILEGDCYSEGNFYLVGVDTETQGVNWYDPNSVIISYQVSKDLNEGWTVILHEECEKDQGDFNIVVQRGGTQKKPEYVETGVKKAENYDQKVAELKELLERQDIKKYFFNQKFEQHRFMNLGITEWTNCCMDARTAAHCCDSELYRDCSLEDLISQFTTSSQSHKGAVSDAEKADMFMLLTKDRNKFIKYASLDASFTLQVCIELRKELLKDQKSLNYFIKFAQPIENEFLFEMERNGVLVDRQKIPEIKEKLQEEIRDKEKQFKKYCPPIVYHRHKDNFKLTRTLILQEALFEWTDKKAKKGKEVEHHNYGFNLEPIVVSPKAGTPSTDKKQVLNTILDGKYPKKVKNLVQTHIEWNERRLLLNNFIKNIEKYLDENDRLHTNFSITFSSSGRTGSRSPNLQNLPKRGPLAKIIRELFIPPEGYKLVHCDYNASELRWVAHVAKEKEMEKIFREGKDPHRITGLEMRNLPENYEFSSEKELKDTRQEAKCFHPDTEVLTEKGWVELKNLQKNEKIYQAIPKDKDGVYLELVEPTYLEIRKNHCSTLVHMKNEGIDLHVTPDHRMLIERKTGNFDIVEPKEFNKCRYFYNSGVVKEGKECDERLLRLAIATQADGNFNGSQIRFGFTKKHKIDRLKSLLNENEYAESLQGIKYVYTSIRLKKDISNKVKKYLDSDKTFKWEYLNYSKLYRDIIINEVRYWDAFKMEGWRCYSYCSTIEKNVNVLQAVCAISGVKTRKVKAVSKKENHKPIYKITIRENGKSRGENIKAQEYYYKEDVVVLSVPSSFVLVRNNGVSVVTGQCLNFGLIYLMTPNGLKKYAKQGYGVELTDKQAYEKYEKFFRKFYNIPKWHERDKEVLHKHGFLRTVFGRKRNLPKVWSEERKDQMQAERTGINILIQGPSSDATLLGGYNILKDERVKHDECRINLFIHDALVLEIAQDKIHYYLPIIKHHMENIPTEGFGFKLSVPLLIEAEVGDRLSDLEEVEI